MSHELGFIVVGEKKMHCSGCETRVVNALGRLPGVRRVAANAGTQRIEVSVDAGGPDAASLIAHLARLGYRAVPVEVGAGTNAATGAR